MDVTFKGSVKQPQSTFSEKKPWKSIFFSIKSPIVKKIHLKGLLWNKASQSPSMDMCFCIEQPHTFSTLIWIFSPYEWVPQESMGRIW